MRSESLRPLAGSGGSRAVAVELALDLAGMRREQQDAVADQHGLRDRVGHEQHREARIGPQLEQLVLHPAPRERIERGERLVHQQHVRLHRQRPRDGDALFHAAGQRVRIGIRELGEVDLLDVAHRLRLGRVAAHLARGFQREHHVLLDRFPRQQLVELLEHEHPVGARRADGQTLEAHAALGRRHVAADRLEQGRLAASGGPEEHEPVRAVNVEADAIGGGDEVLLGPVLQCHPLHLQERRRAGWNVHRGVGPSGIGACATPASRVLSCRAARGPRGRTSPSSSPA